MKYSYTFKEFLNNRSLWFTTGKKEKIGLKPGDCIVYLSPSAEANGNIPVSLLKTLRHSKFGYNKKLTAWNRFSVDSHFFGSRKYPNPSARSR